MRSGAGTLTAECSETVLLLGTQQEAFQSAESLNECGGFSKLSTPIALNSYENLLPSLGLLSPFSLIGSGQTR